MSIKPLLIFDFDGVIIDGLVEYWNSAQKAYFQIVKQIDELNVNQEVPNSFRVLRPWVKNGWEMVILAGEILDPESSLNTLGSKIFAQDYTKNCTQALIKNSWSPEQLQKALDNVRKQAINDNPHEWLASHKEFPFVVQRLKQLHNEDTDFGVLTTKSAEFTSSLLNHLHIYPTLLYGHESGEKAEILYEIVKTRPVAGFIEDRRSTLETIINTPGLESIDCYLATWGYLKPADMSNLPSKIHLLEKKQLMSPLANWT
ncbi:HAD family hydrolase [Prochlorococcus marinus]|uniref:HAD family hydrolase n=1 Tax=Prochlorococcus marinus TaxID=1219 RepID=UPI0022B34B38|nr:HAD family hydrolase [Prochlorococcus marinus]